MTHFGVHSHRVTIDPRQDFHNLYLKPIGVHLVRYNNSYKPVSKSPLQAFALSGNAERDAGHMIQFVFGTFYLVEDVIVAVGRWNTVFILSTHILNYLILALKNQVVFFALIQVEHLLKVTPKLEVGYIFGLEELKRLIHVLTVMLPKLLFHLVIKLRKLRANVAEGLFSDCEARHISFCSINE